MSEKNSNRVAFEMFMTDSNHPISAGGYLVFHKDGNRYEGALDLQQPVRLQNELVHGREVACNGIEAIEFATVDRSDKILVRLVKNPYERRQSYAGSASYQAYVYNVCAYAASSS